jgi:dTDP-4-dehydrorhamnose reductase
MKILLTGASGLLGHDIWKVFSDHHELTGIGRNRPPHIPLKQWRDCDITNAPLTYTLVTRENPDLIIHGASYNDVDGAETHRDEAFLVNAIGTRNLALACQRFDTVLMAISTDYVFDGQNAPENGYREFDIPHPQGAYAESKRWAEIYVEQLLHKYFIVRTSWLFGSARPTFVDKIVSWAQEGKPVPCMTDMRSAPTSTADLAKALHQLAESRCFGLYHLTNSEFCTRVELAEEVLGIHKLPTSCIKRLTQAQLKLPAHRPTFSGLENLAWRLNGFPPLRSWKDALRDHFGARLSSR